MTIPLLTNSWQFQVNQSVLGTGSSTGNSDRFLFLLKEALLGIGSWTDGYGNATVTTGNWVVVGSSDGSIAGLDGYDRIVSESDFNSAGGGGNHGWIVLSNPALLGDFEICLDGRVEADMDVYTSILGFGSSAGGTDGYINARPTASDEVTHVDFLNDSSSTSENYRFHFMKTATGTGFRVVICNSGAATRISFIEAPGSSVNGWATPYFMGSKGTTSISGSKYLYISNIRTIPLKSHNVNEMNLVFTSEGWHGSTIVADAVYGGDIFDNGIAFFPLGLASFDVGQRGRHGAVTDIWVSLDQLVDGVTFPNDSSKQFVQFGCLVLPWNTTSPQLMG